MGQSFGSTVPSVQYEPAGQVVHAKLVSLQYCPDPHCVHALEPGAAYVPVAQVEQVVALDAVEIVSCEQALHDAWLVDD